MQFYVRQIAGKCLFSSKILPRIAYFSIFFQLPDSPANRIVAAFARDKFVLQAGDQEYAPLNFPCWQFEPFRSILLNEDLRKYKTDRNPEFQKEFSFMKHFKK
jgi:hypothetical protein